MKIMSTTIINVDAQLTLYNRCFVKLVFACISSTIKYLGKSCYKYFPLTLEVSF